MHSSGVNKLLTALARGQSRKFRDMLRHNYGWVQLKLYGYPDGMRRAHYLSRQVYITDQFVRVDDEGEYSYIPWIDYIAWYMPNTDLEAANLSTLVARTRQKLMALNRRSKTRDLLLKIFDGWCAEMTQSDLARELRMSRERVRQLVNILLTTTPVRDMLLVITEHHQFYRTLWEKRQHDLRKSS